MTWICVLTKTGADIYLIPAKIEMAETEACFPLSFLLSSSVAKNLIFVEMKDKLPNGKKKPTNKQLSP
jgi:hypothetical protein